MKMRRNRKASSGGSALLSVLWLSAALSAIAFSIAVTVRGETERTSVDLDGLRCGYVASAAVERAAMELLWSATTDKKMIQKGAISVDYQFPSGDARVAIIPETAKLDVNHTAPEELLRLMAALGVDSGRATTIAHAIDEWRRPGAPDKADAHYQAFGPSFRLPHASFEEIEELLLLPGVTPEIFYGGFASGEGADDDQALSRRPGLIDCLSVYGSTGLVDVNTADPAVLQAVGVSAADARNIAGQRGQKPYDSGGMAGLGSGRLRTEGNTIVTFRATARLRTGEGKYSDLRRTVAAQVKYFGYGSAGLPYHVLRWYDYMTSD
jgi:general secretion pathway protein K